LLGFPRHAKRNKRFFAERPGTNPAMPAKPPWRWPIQEALEIDPPNRHCEEAKPTKQSIFVAVTTEKWIASLRSQ
jgi:hypothetical protein